MHIRSSYKLATSALLVATLAACGTAPVFGGVTPAGSGLSPSTNQPNSASTPTGDLCANPFVPVKLGATWNYINTGVAAQPVSLSTTITNVRADGFTVATHFDDSISVEQDWACKPEGLLALTLGSGQTALGLSMEGITASILTSDVTGITLPSNIQPGMKWPYGLHAIGNIMQGNFSAKMSGTASTTMQAMGTESVTVPAGTFTATKISGKTTFDMIADYYGINIPISSVVTSTFWFAPGVGWIKSVQTGELPGTSVNSATELQSYTIP